MPEKPLPASLRAGHEITGVSAGGVAKFVLLFFIPTMLFIFLAIWFLLGFDVRRQARDDTPPFPLGIERPTTLPQPLQPSIAHAALPWQDLPLLRSQDEQTLHTSGPLPGDTAHIHIPISRTMQLFLTRGGLSAQPATQPTSRPEELPVRPPSVENRT